MADINLIKPDTILPNIRPFRWDVEINGKSYLVARFEGFVHSIDGRWGENDLWAWPRNEKPSYNNLIEFNGEGGATWGIQYNEKRYINTKWDETYTDIGRTIVITRNGIAFFKFPGTMYEGIDQARIYISKLREHPIPFDTINWLGELINRKVWWRSQPGIILYYISERACVVIVPDGFEQFDTPAEFATDDTCIAADEDNTRVVADIFDPHIYWFRD